MIALVRHAATDWSGARYCGRIDLPLNLEGREQLRPLVECLSALAPRGTTVVAGPARRCRQTALAITSSLGGEACFDDRLGEIDFGEAEGMTFAQLERRWPSLAARLLRDAQVDWPGGERWSDFAARVTAAWRELSGQPHDTVVITHGGPLRLMLGLALPRCAASALAHIGPAHVVALAREQGWSVRATWSPSSDMPLRS